jgi:hypothetical protein
MVGDERDPEAANHEVVVDELLDVVPEVTEDSASAGAFGLLPSSNGGAGQDPEKA